MIAVVFGAIAASKTDLMIDSDVMNDVTIANSDVTR